MVKCSHLIAIILRLKDGEIPVFWLNDAYILITTPPYSFANPMKPHEIRLNPNKFG